MPPQELELDSNDSLFRAEESLNGNLAFGAFYDKDTTSCFPDRVFSFGDDGAVHGRPTAFRADGTPAKFGIAAAVELGVELVDEIHCKNTKVLYGTIVRMTRSVSLLPDDIVAKGRSKLTSPVRLEQRIMGEEAFLASKCRVREVDGHGGYQNASTDTQESLHLCELDADLAGIGEGPNEMEKHPAHFQNFQRVSCFSDSHNLDPAAPTANASFLRFVSRLALEA